jgi:hypothetical protein
MLRRFRSAITGRFVGQSEARANPTVTVGEKIVVPTSDAPIRALGRALQDELDKADAMIVPRPTDPGEWLDATKVDFGRNAIARMAQAVLDAGKQ